MKVIIVSTFIGVYFLALLGTLLYAYYVCVKYIKEHKR